MNQKQKILIVEDDLDRRIWFARNFPKDELFYARNSYQAIDLLAGEDFAKIFMDFDLGMGTNGVMVTSFMVKERSNCDAEIIIHSMNPVGANEMFLMLRSTHKNVVLRPFYTHLLKDSNVY